MKNKMLFQRVKISGVNLNRLYKECQKNNISLFDINRINYKNIEVDIDKKDLAKVKQICKEQNYSIDTLKSFGLVKLFSQLKSRIGIIVGCFIFIFLAILNSFFVWDIKVYGNSRIETSQIISILNKQGIQVGKTFAKFDSNLLENSILNQLEDISLCSVVKKGNCIIINIKEKLEASAEVSASNDVVAEQNMTIKSINVIQGTALKKAGDSVKKGEVIVAGYFEDINGTRRNCKANAVVSATTWFTSTETYQKIANKKTRTGKKCVESYFSIFKLKLPISKKQNSFKNFDSEENESYVFVNNILPVKKITKTFFEVEITPVKQDFEKDKESVVQRCKENAIKSVPQNLKVERTFETIAETEDAFVVTAYAEVNITI